MNNNSIGKQKIIMELMPSLRMFWVDNLGLCAMYLVMILLAGYDNRNVSVCALIISFFIAAVMLYKFWYLSRLKWTITEKQLIRECGVFTRDKQFIELYRVIDYSEKQSFLQLVLNLKDIIIYSQDRTTPSERIYGIPASVEIITLFKELVENQKKEYHVYEITNR